MPDVKLEMHAKQVWLWQNMIQMNDNRTRTARERNTIRFMIGIYCRGHHRQNALCPDCQELLDYAIARLEACPFQERKTTCARCRIHCYRPELRERIRTVMRYAGPRMIYRHPVLAVRHLIEGLRKEPLPERD